jgi:hypothetical protein
MNTAEKAVKNGVREPYLRHTEIRKNGTIHTGTYIRTDVRTYDGRMPDFHTTKIKAFKYLPHTGDVFIAYIH